MKKLLYTLLAVSIIFTACEEEEAPSPFAGTWVGTFDGDDSGTWSGTVSADGVLNGLAGPYIGIGNVGNDGVFYIAFGTVSSGATFDGIANGSTVEGDWTNSSVQPSMSGSWEGDKQ